MNGLQDFKFVLVGALVFVTFGVFEYYRKNRPCEECGGKLDVIRTKDPLGKNLTNNITVGLSLGFPHNRMVKKKCRECGHIVNSKRCN